MEAAGPVLWQNVEMPTLYLVRHGIAEDRSSSGRDEDRSLSQEGTVKLQRAAAGLSALDIQLDTITASPLLRARQTATIMRDALAEGLEITIDPELRPEADIEAVAQRLQVGAGARSMMLVGHEPSISALAAALLTGSPHGARLPFKPGSVAAIELPNLPPVDRGTLRWFLTPDLLDRLALPLPLRVAKA